MIVALKAISCVATIVGGSASIALRFLDKKEK